MKKVFIDCGANNGCSVKLFESNFSDYKDFTDGSFTNNSSQRVGHAYKRIV